MTILSASQRFRPDWKLSTIAGFLAGTLVWSTVNENLAWILTFMPAYAASMYIARLKERGRQQTTQMLTLDRVSGGLMLAFLVWQMEALLHHRHWL